MLIATIALFEVALLGIAMTVIHLANLSAETAATPLNLGVGLAVGLALAGAATVLLRGKGAFSRRLRRDFDTVLEIGQKFSLLDMAFVSLLAGLCEEALFRGGLQLWLTRPLGPAGAIAVAALAFGAAHVVSVPYVVAATIIGAVLGATFHLTGSLAAAMIAHAGYDFVLFWWGLRLRGRAPSGG